MSVELIEQLSNAFGISGFEDEVASIAKSYLQSITKVKEDKMGNLYFSKEEEKNNSSKVKVLLDAHLDEVGFIVQAIQPNGMIEFLPVGGWVSHNVPAHPVIIRTETGQKISGLTASIPPHFLSAKERHQVLQMDDILIDVGTSSKEETQKLGIQIGDPIVPDVQFKSMREGKLFRGKAFDCRIGCACLLDTYKTFLAKNESHNIQVEAVLTTQEEVGARGAQVVANQIDADLAIVFEGCPADDTFTPDYKIQSALNKGPMLRDFDVSMITHPGFQGYALNLAQKHQIPVQRSVRKGGGTNGEVYHIASKGIPTIVVGIPVRYAHTHYGYVAYQDYLAAKELVLTLLAELTPEIYHAI
ncbi:M42 family metallopeptidase [Ignavigranum ruoffiae]|uniref:M42 family metallopeptidase n=1 Tax=Ignavigranum ruoffiae TaxID=89093 RepID=UPI0024ADD832|nr:M20/M25/M40 family metallo-hydrolase [Ignavigranum ruoffiae]